MMVNLFSSFSDPADLRRGQTNSVRQRVGAMALVLGVVTGYALVGLGVRLGLSLALVNFRLIFAARPVKVAAPEEENKRRPLAFNTLGRLGVISVVAWPSRSSSGLWASGP